jgi:hypothetical protein
MATEISFPPAPDGAAAVPVRVVEITAERHVDDPVEIPWHLAGAPGSVAVQLRSTLRRVSIGAGLARRPELVAAVRAIPGVPAVAVSPAGGTFIVGGPTWLGLSAIGVLPPGQPMPLDWMMAALEGFFAERLGRLGLAVSKGRIDGAWCPGFSDLGVAGQKLIGLGFRVTRGLVAMRGIMPVQAIDDADWELLGACHGLIDIAIRRESATSVAECTGDAGWTVARGFELLGG